MNDPEYILVDEFGTKDENDILVGGVLKQVQKNLGIPSLNYQYGTIEELNETLAQWGKDPDFAQRKFPLVWLVQPFTLARGYTAVFARVKGGLRLFIIVGTDDTLKAKDRMAEKFKPLIYPILRQLLVELNNHPAIQLEFNRGFEATDRYWFSDQQKEINDKVDCLEITGLQIGINNNQNCCTIADRPVLN